MAEQPLLVAVFNLLRPILMVATFTAGFALGGVAGFYTARYRQSAL